MTLEIALVLLLVCIAFVLFVSEKFSFDVVAFFILSYLMLTGILSPEESLSGFSNPATITIAAMFAVSEGIRNTGALEMVGKYLNKVGKYGFTLATLSIFLTIALISAFINNTSAVILFIPVIMNVAAVMDISPSKLLIPLSFSSMLGGVCTLIGTSTNILVSSIAVRNGEQPFSMFELTPLGLIFLSIGITFIVTIGVKIIPARRKRASLTETFKMHRYLTDIILKPGCSLSGKNVEEVKNKWNPDLEIVRIFRNNQALPVQPKQIVQTGDVLRVRATPQEIQKLLAKEHISLKKTRNWEDFHLKEGDYALVEGVIAPDSDFENRRIKDIYFPQKYGSIVLGILKKGRIRQKALNNIYLSGGDSLLLSVHEDQLERVKNEPSFVMVSHIPIFKPLKKKMPLALIILFGIVGSAALGALPLVSAALIGATLMVMTRIISPGQIYKSINWKIIFLLAGVIPLGIALEKTGTANLISNGILSLTRDLGPRAVLSFFFFSTMMITSVISNQATGALLAPIAIQLARAMAVSPRPFLIAVTFAASLSFLSPIAYQTNTLVYGPGHYKFTDYFRVGIWLNLIFWAVATFMIPLLWEF